MIKKLICYLRGHVWEDLPYEDGPKGWSYEHKACLHCGAYSRVLVVGRLG